MYTQSTTTFWMFWWVWWGWYITCHRYCPLIIQSEAEHISYDTKSWYESYQLFFCYTSTFFFKYLKTAFFCCNFLILFLFTLLICKYLNAAIYWKFSNFLPNISYFRSSKPLSFSLVKNWSVQPHSCAASRQPLIPNSTSENLLKYFILPVNYFHISLKIFLIFL